jgi:uncharacterized protein YwgA
MVETRAERLLSSDLILLLLVAEGPEHAPVNRLNGVTRLEKLLFLLDKETNVQRGVDEPFRFRPYNYGPYSREVYEAVDLLEEAGLINEERVLEGHTLDEMEEAATAAIDKEGIERRFSLTQNGLAVAKLLARRHPEEFKEIGDIKKSYAGMPLRQLIRYVYNKYPKYAEESKIRDQVH